MQIRTLRRLFSSTVGSSNVITEFEFDPKYFSQNMKSLVNETPKPSVEEVRRKNDEKLKILKAKAGYDEDPFTLIEKDVDLIK